MGKRVVQTKFLQPCDDKAESETTNSMTVLKKRNSEPTIKLSVGDIVDCYVDEIIKEKEKVGLSLIKPTL